MARHYAAASSPIANLRNSVAVQGFQAGPDTDNGSRYNEVGPGYFSTLGIPLKSGREFTDADVVNAPRVAIVNEEFVRKFGLGHDAVGKMMGSGNGYKSTLDTMASGWRSARRRRGCARWCSGK